MPPMLRIPNPDEMEDEAPAAAPAPPLGAAGSLLTPLVPAPVDEQAPMPRIGDSTPMGRFAMPSLPPVEQPSIVTPRQKERGTQRILDEQALAKLNGPHLGEAGSRLPGLGGKILHGLAVAGNVAGSILDPGAMALIPGTNLGNNVRRSNIEKDLGDLSKEESDDTVEQSQNNERRAQANEADQRAAGIPTKTADEHAQSAATTGHLNAETDALKGPQYEVHDTADGPLFVNKKTGEAQHLSLNGLPIGPKLQTETADLEIGGKPHKVLVNKDTGTVIKDLGASGIKPPVVNVHAGESLEREKRNDALKAFQPTLDSAERMNVMTENYEKAVKDHDQQAMLSLLANHLGMTMGLQKGARISKDIVQEAQKSQPMLQGLAAKFDKDGYLSGVTLSPPQMRQMVGLGQSRYSEDAKKSRATSKYLGNDDDGPDRIPNEATIRYYTGLAKGDPAKAKALALADGWTVK